MFYNLFNQPETLNSQVIKLDGAELLYIPQFYDKLKSDMYFQQIISNVEWKQDFIKMYGRELPLPRLSAWYGDSNKPYTYSGITLKPKTWTPELTEIKTEIEKQAGVNFTSVLINRYRDGQDYVGWHTDAEKELGENPTIGSINFGATRKFQLRRIDNHKEKIELELKHGTLLIMRGETQLYWQHQVPKTNRPIGERLNLTFRVINSNQ
jgi:alkylated DNA repair dioxygenase AlkB